MFIRQLQYPWGIGSQAQTSVASGQIFFQEHLLFQHICLFSKCTKALCMLGPSAAVQACAAFAATLMNIWPNVVATDWWPFQSMALLPVQHI